MTVVSITRLHVRSWRYLAPFLFYSLRSLQQAKAAEGNFHASVMRDRHNAFWTRTLWKSEEAMKAFMLSGAHRGAMPRLLDWCDEAALVSWRQESDAAPNWSEAYRHLQQEGRRSKVRHPAPAHEKYEIARPEAV
jgi:heme-degrading monooxygenase HmoA